MTLTQWPPPGVKWYYSDSACCIAHGDCRQILPLLPKVDLVLTDVPYGEVNRISGGLRKIHARAGIVIAAWGMHGKHLYRSIKVKQVLPNLMCLGRNSDGTPKHPLYLKADSKPTDYQ